MIDIGADLQRAFDEGYEKGKADRPQGKWIPHPTYREWDVCDNCGIGCKRREHGEIDGIGWVKEYNYPYCPNCGAKMDKE